LPPPAATAASVVKKRLSTAGHHQSVFAANWWGVEFWRFVLVQQEVAKLARTAIDFPPMQRARASTKKPSSSRSKRPCNRAPADDAMLRAVQPTS